MAKEDWDEKEALIADLAEIVEEYGTAVGRFL